MSKQTTKVNSSFGRKVRDLRRKKWGQKRLAHEAGVSERTISRIESLKEGQNRSFDTKILEDIAKALGTTLDNLPGIDDHQPSRMDWISARREVIRCLERNKSVNLLTAEGSEWRSLIKDIKTEFEALGIVDLESGATTTRKDFVEEILKSLLDIDEGIPNGEDLVILDRRLSERHLSRLALLHFDLVTSREQQYGINLFATLRNLIESDKLVLIVQSRKPVPELFPQDHPLSPIELETIELGGTT